MAQSTAAKTEDFLSWIDGFFLFKNSNGVSERTLQDYHSAFLALHRWCNETHHLYSPSFTTSELRTFLSWRRVQVYQGKRISPKTLQNNWAALRSFYKWNSEEEDLPNPMLSISLPRGSTRVIEPLSKEEITALLKACDRTHEAKTSLREVFVMKRVTPVVGFHGLGNPIHLEVYWPDRLTNEQIQELLDVRLLKVRPVGALRGQSETNARFRITPRKVNERIHHGNNAES